MENVIINYTFCYNICNMQSSIHLMPSRESVFVSSNFNYYLIVQLLVTWYLHCLKHGYLLLQIQPSTWFRNTGLYGTSFGCECESDVDNDIHCVFFTIISILISFDMELHQMWHLGFHLTCNFHYGTVTTANSNHNRHFALLCFQLNAKRTLSHSSSWLLFKYIK